jgi:hypothetical protein
MDARGAQRPGLIVMQRALTAFLAPLKTEEAAMQKYRQAKEAFIEAQ